MQQSLSVVLERNTRLSGAFTTEPYEVAWAREARWFVRVLDTQGEATTLSATTQISPDGLHWCDLEGSGGTIEGRGLVSWPAREFGGWLRIKGSVDGPSGSSIAKVLIYLVLKS
jgi:hypothetical protein